MSLHDPAALRWLLLALPLVALYLVRPRARERRVGSLLLYRLLSRRQAARAPLARLEKLLSLLLHLAALAGIVLALAGPSFGPVAPRRIVAILDASTSMGARLDGVSRFEKAKERARALARELRSEDELGFVLAGPTPHLLLAPAPRAARPELALDAVRLEGGKTNLADALALAGASAPTEIWVLSDGAARPERRARPKGEPEVEGRIFYARFGLEDDPNVGVASLAARAAPGSESEVEIQATLVNASSRTAIVRPTFTLDRLPLVALEPLALGPWSRTSLPARRLELRGGGVLGLHIACDGDVLAADDDAFVAVPALRRTRVSDPTGPEAFFLRAALEADDSVSLDGTPPDVTLGERFVLGPEETAAVASRFELRDLGTVVPPRVSRVAREHPVLRHVALEDAVFAKARAVTAPPGWKVLAEAGSVPLILAREARQGEKERALVFTFAPESADLVLRRAWPLLVSNAVSWLRGEVLRESEEPVRTGSVARIACERPATAVRAGDEEVPFVQENGTVTVTATASPGIYEVFSGTERVARFAVSVLDEESSRVAARSTLGIGEEPAPSERPAVETLELPALLPLLAVLLLVVESWAHHRREIG